MAESRYSSSAAGSPRVSTADQQQTLTALTIVAVGFLVTLAYGLLSTAYYHADDLTHYLFARWAWQWPEYLLHNWGRPGFTALYFLPAQFGWGATRAWSAGLSAICAWMTFRIAAHLRVPHCGLVPLFVYLQPRFFTLATTTLTETALAFYLTLAVFLALRQRWSWAAALLSLGLTARHEAIVLLPVFGAAAWFSGASLVRLWPVVLAPIVVNVLAWVAGMPSALSLYLDADASGVYGRGGWYEFFSRTLEAFGPAIAALGFAGMGRTWTLRGGPLVVGCALTLFVTHAVLRKYGMFDSGGYARFLVPISGLWAILALVAWNRLTHPEADRRTRAVVSIALAFVLLWLTAELQIESPEASPRDWTNVAAEVPRLWHAKWALRFGAIGVALAALVHWSAGSHALMSALPMRWVLGGAFTLLSIVAILLARLAWIVASSISSAQTGVAEEAAAELLWLGRRIADAPAAPLAAALLVLLGWTWLITKLLPREGQRLRRTAMGLSRGSHRAFVGMFAAIAFLAWHEMNGPLHPRPVERIIDEELAWLRRSGYGDRPVVAAHVWAVYRTDTALRPNGPPLADRIEQAPIGAVILWDKQFAVYMEKPPVMLDSLFFNDRQFKHLHASRALPNDRPAVQLFEKVGADQPRVDR